MVTFRIDELVPCLKSVETGEIFETEVVQIKRKSVLSKYNKKSGWYVNWSKFPEDTEIYALMIKGTFDVQGLVAIRYDEDAKAVYMLWGCTSPENNVWQYGKQKYKGVGGHLMAIASELSVKHGFDGFVYGEAMDEELFFYYCNEFNAMPLPPRNNPYCFMLSDSATEHLREVYTYEWTTENL